MSDLDKINSIFNAKIDTVKNKEDLQNIKTEFFGKNGQITQQFKTLGSLEPDKRKKFASNLNKINHYYHYFISLQTTSRPIPYLDAYLVCV